MLLARCQRTATPNPVVVTCYTIAPPTQTPGTPAPTRLAALDRVRLCWLRFSELAEKTSDDKNTAENLGDPLGSQMISDHRSALDELVAAGGITPAVADLIHEAYVAAVFHIWRSNAAMTCYITAGPAYAPAGADDLLRQAETLNQIAGGGTVTPETLAKVQAALERDFAYYALSDEDVRALYARLLEEYSDPGETIPSFNELELTLTADVRAAAQFLIDVLMG
jgi:hypothetical protein